MILNDVDYGVVWNSSGACGFFGEPDEYKHHKYWRLLGLDYSDTTFVAKTVTTDARVGNMPVDRRGRPKNFLPDCIRCKFLKGVVLNAVGLTNMGVLYYLKANRWQMRTAPFVLSYAPSGVTGEEMVIDADKFGRILSSFLGDFNAPFALQINFSCPNVDHASDVDTYMRVIRTLDNILHVPLIPKFNALEPVETAVNLVDAGLCAAVSVGNTIPWGREPDCIDWKRLFGSHISPLDKYGGGGLSGWPLLPFSQRWISIAKKLFGSTPIIAGGGILGPSDVVALTSVGADVIELGVIGILRPYRMRATVKMALMLNDH